MFIFILGGRFKHKWSKTNYFNDQKRKNRSSWFVTMIVFLKAVVIIGGSSKITFIKGPVDIRTEQDGFNSGVHKHALCPLLQLRCVVQEAGNQIIHRRKDNILQSSCIQGFELNLNEYILIFNWILKLYDCS